jgi:hypothetical protein
MLLYLKLEVGGMLSTQYAAVSHPVMWDFLTMHAKTSCAKYPHYNPFHVEFFPHSNRMPKPKSKLELKPTPKFCARAKAAA